MSLTVFLGLGGNLGDVPATIYRAVGMLSAIPEICFIQLSPLYRNPPMGPIDQPDYVNAVCQLTSDLTAKQLLIQTQTIESKLGRVRKSDQWSARTLDIDILLFGQQEIKQADLIIPHYGIAERAFVLLPLSDLVDELNIPGIGNLNDLLADIDVSGMSEVKR